jgi:hypothetical protein
MDKIIYLDMDGVINNRKTFLIPGKSSIYAYDEILISNLNSIIEEINAKIVLSSTWRLCFKDTNSFNKHLTFIGIYPVCIGFTPKPNECNSWNGSFCNRYIEIKTHIKHNSIDKFVVIDDENKTLEKFGNAFFKTDFEYGLTKDISDKIIEYLK